MAPKMDAARRNRLTYLALYYAIQGDEQRSEQVRKMLRQARGQEQPVYGQPAPVP